MIARFFVDRPIFATVISIVFVLAGGVAVFTLPVAQYPDVSPPTVQVTAHYPGANATTVRDTVAAPIEEQVSGVEDMMYMSSRCTNDGAYNLIITFKNGTDSDMAQVLVQNRVSLALPVVPPLVQNEGVTVTKMSPNTLMIVNLISPDGSYDDTRLSNYATIYVRDELNRLPGVADVSYLGQRDYSLRAWLDPDRLAALNIGPMDVVAAISAQNVQVAAGQIGQPPAPKGQPYQLTINTQGRLTDPDQFADIIVKAAPVTQQAQSAALASADSSVAASSTASASSSSAGASGGSTGQTSPAPLSSGIVRLRDVVTRDKTTGKPRVELGSQQYDQGCTLNKQPTVALSIYQLPGFNALNTAQKVYDKMRELKGRFPEGVDYKIVYDTTPFIRQSVYEVFYTLIAAVVLVAVVVLLFLQDWRAMILPMIDVPVSLIGTFVVMAALGFTLNNLTLFGLVLAIGIVVDDAIVVLENIERLMATGLDARTATIKAMEEITGPVLAITLVLSSVFIPCCFLGGVSGKFFQQFAVTISVSTIISAVNALTMTPSRAVLIFKADEHAPGHAHRREALPWWFFGVVGAVATLWLGEWLLSGRFGLPARNDFLAGLFGLPAPDLTAGADLSPVLYWGVKAAYAVPGALAGGLLGWLLIRPVNRVLAAAFGAFNRLFDRLAGLYRGTVGNLLRVCVVVLPVYGGLLLLTWLGFTTTPTGFIPQQDKGYLLLNVRLPSSTSMEVTKKAIDKIEALAHDETPGVANTIGLTGKSLILNANAPNLGSVYVLLKDFNQRRGLSADEVARDLQERCSREAPEAIVTTFGAPPIDGLGTTGGFTLMVEDRGGLGMDALQQYSDQIRDEGNNARGLQGLFNSSEADTPWLYLKIDRTKAMSLGVQVSDIFNALQVYLGSYYVNNFNEFGRTWQVNIQADTNFRDRIDDIKRLQVRSANNQMVRLGSMMDVRLTGGPVMVLRYNMYTAAAVTGDAGPNTSSQQAIDRMQDVADRTLPNAMVPEWTDLAKLQQDAGGSAMWFFALAVLFVFMVLAAQYESWSLPLAVILVVPMCLLCSIAGLLLAHTELNVFTQIGFVVLVGLASKNAILIVEFAKQQQAAGASRREATLEACRLRLRPILMTSFAFILGVAPLVVAEGAGAEMRHSLGLAVFSGMLGVTLFGVFLTPVFYYVIQRFAPAAPAAPPHPVPVAADGGPAPGDGSHNIQPGPAPGDGRDGG